MSVLPPRLRLLRAFRNAIKRHGLRLQVRQRDVSPRAQGRATSDTIQSPRDRRQEEQRTVPKCWGGLQKSLVFLPSERLLRGRHEAASDGAGDGHRDGEGVRRSVLEGSRRVCGSDEQVQAEERHSGGDVQPGPIAGPPQAQADLSQRLSAAWL